MEELAADGLLNSRVQVYLLNSHDDFDNIQAVKTEVIRKVRGTSDLELDQKIVDCRL